MDETRESLNAVRSAIAEADKRIAEIVSSTKSDALSRVGELQTQLTELDEQMKALQDREKRLEIVAPVDGIVQHMAVKAVNAVAKPGETLLEIVPKEEDMLIEARVSPADIGHIHKGQDVDLKISS